MDFFDSHCHLDAEQFDDDREETIQRAREAGVRYLVCIGSGYGPDDAGKAVELAEQHDDMWATIGVHPHDAAKVSPDNWKALRDLARSDKVVAWGEIGLDYYYDHSPRHEQNQAFVEQLELATELNLPVSLHVREAATDTLVHLRDFKVRHGERLRGIWHCFTENVDVAREAVDLGFFISIPGIVTFPKGENIREVVKEIPVDKMVIETDSPYLTPVPHRGKRNEPAYVVETAKKIAELKGLALEDVARVTTRNALLGYEIHSELEQKAEVAYTIRNSRYLNLTNRCTIACAFCHKFTDWIVKGHYLKLPDEPSVDEAIAAVGNPSQYDEIVFCGYGEPTIRLDDLKEVSRRLREAGAKRIRLDTDGLGSLIHDRDIVPELEGVVDAVNVSLNAPDSDTYDRVCRTPPKYRGGPAYEAVKKFIARCKDVLPDVQASAVSYPGVNIEACRRIAEDELGVRFRHRVYEEVG